ncbi:MAG: threonine aldolase family protein [Planctomycetota bacterium]|jgi:threonine aldolase
MDRPKADFRSDTVTLPTARMMEAMSKARVGDDVLGDDPTVRRLEKRMASLFGKESALFMPSGTMANQCAVASHIVPGEEVIVDSEAHLFMFEGGGLSRISGAHVRTLETENGQYNFGQLARAIRPVSEHMPRTGMIAVEETHLFSGGTIVPIDYLEEVHGLAQHHGIPVHMDGARLFNAQAETGVAFEEYGRYCDSVFIALSKGLSCPVGSVLIGDGSFIERARRVRKWMGGGMRQAGYLAACGLIALEETAPLLGEDNARCRRLGGVTLGMDGVQLAQATIDTNILFLEITQSGLDAPMVEAALADEGVLALALGDRLLRFVTHRHITDADVDRAASALQTVLQN